VPEAVGVSSIEPSQGYQLRVVQEVLLALLAKEASHGYQLRARLQLALGPLAEVLNAGHVYVTLTRLEKAGLLTSKRVGQIDRPDRKVYELTPAGRTRVTEWLGDTSWPKRAPAEFHRAAGSSSCSPWRASPSSSEAEWPTRSGASDCSRRSAAHRAWSPPCCSPST
jgi:DNA-binding PadR family transcriptional regulator